MIAFLGSFVQYVVIFLILAGIAFLGGFVGVQLRKKKDAKEAAKPQEHTEE